MQRLKLLGMLLALLCVGNIANVSALDAAVRDTTVAPKYSASFYPVAKTSRHVIGSPIVTMPQASALVAYFDADTLIGTVSNGAEVTSLTDSVGLINATAPAGSGPTFATNVANGHAALRYSARSKYLSIGRPAALTSAMASGANWSVVIVFRNAGNTGTVYSAMLGDNLANMSLGASATGVNNPKGNVVTRSYSSGDPAANIHTMAYVYEGNGVSGRTFADGTMYFAPIALSFNTGTDPLYIGNVLTSAGGSIDGTRGFTGDILLIAFFNVALSPAEVWQADGFARWRFGKQLATAGLADFGLFEGDSQTFGTSATPDTAMPVLVANSLGLKQGQFANLGKPSAGVAAGTGSGNNLMDHAVRDADQFRRITGLPIWMIAGEYYNQGAGGGTEPTGATLASNNRTYCYTRRLADPTIRISMWTSLASWQRQGATRDGFNKSLVANPGACDQIIPVHLDPMIGVDGAFGTSGAPSAVSDGSGIHLNSIGTPYHAADVLPFAHR